MIYIPSGRVDNVLSSDVVYLHSSDDLDGSISVGFKCNNLPRPATVEIDTGLDVDDESPCSVGVGFYTKI